MVDRAVSQRGRGALPEDKAPSRNTRLVWCESPGSVTMEVQDVPAIAHAAGAYKVCRRTQ
jgi:cystathionine beta-lyase/cystathionine gamma-synthase